MLPNAARALPRRVLALGVVPLVIVVATLCYAYRLRGKDDPPILPLRYFGTVPGQPLDRAALCDTRTEWAKNKGFKDNCDWMTAELDFVSERLLLKPGMTLVDIGGASGTYSLPLLNDLSTPEEGIFGKVIVTDSDKSAFNFLNFMRWKGHLWRLVKSVHIDPEKETIAGQIGLEPGCCDAIWIRMSFHHLHIPYLAVKGMADALKPGGRLLIAEHPPKHGSRSDPQRWYKYEKDQPELVNNPGERDLNPFGSFMGIAHWVVHRQVLQDPRFRVVKGKGREEYPGYAFYGNPYSVLFERIPDWNAKHDDPAYYYMAPDVPLQVDYDASKQEKEYLYRVNPGMREFEGDIMGR